MGVMCMKLCMSVKILKMIGNAQCYLNIRLLGQLMWTLPTIKKIEKDQRLEKCALKALLIGIGWDS